jgi:thiamine biosynthesis lipoprotein
MASGCSSYLVDIGGEVRAGTAKPGGQLWRIGIEVPDPERIGGVQRVVVLNELAVATSGDYRNFIEQGNGRYSHTIDPRTGAPVTHDLASVTVLAPSTMAADGLATLLNVLGPQRGFAFAEQHEIAALFIIRTDPGFEERTSSAFERHLN